MFTLVLEHVPENPFIYFSSINMSISTRMWKTLTLYLRFVQHVKVFLIVNNQKIFYRFILEMFQDYFFQKGRTCSIFEIMVYGSNCPHFIVVTCLTAVCWPLIVSCSFREYIAKGNDITIKNYYYLVLFLYIFNTYSV